MTHCDSSSLFLHPSISGKKWWVGGLIVFPLGINPNMVSLSSIPLFFSVFLCSCWLFFSSCLAERPLECSLWPSHWQMLLWNVMKFEMGAAVTIILGQGLSLAWYHYLWQLESAVWTRVHEWEWWWDLVTGSDPRELLVCGGSKQVVHSWRDSVLFCAWAIMYVCSQRGFTCRGRFRSV